MTQTRMKRAGLALAVAMAFTAPTQAGWFSWGLPKIQAVGYNFDYRVTGGEALGLYNVFDDGSKTFLQFRNPSLVPMVLVAKGADTAQAKVTLSTPYVVVDGVSDQLSIVTPQGQAIVRSTRAGTPPQAKSSAAETGVTVAAPGLAQPSDSVASAPVAAPGTASALASPTLDLATAAQAAPVIAAATPATANTPVTLAPPTAKASAAPLEVAAAAPSAPGFVKTAAAPGAALQPAVADSTSRAMPRTADEMYRAAMELNLRTAQMLQRIVLLLEKHGIQVDSREFFRSSPAVEASIERQLVARAGAPMQTAERTGAVRYSGFTGSSVSESEMGFGAGAREGAMIKAQWTQSGRVVREGGTASPLPSGTEAYRVVPIEPAAAPAPPAVAPAAPVAAPAATNASSTASSVAQHTTQQGAPWARPAGGPAAPGAPSAPGAPAAPSAPTAPPTAAPAAPAPAAPGSAASPSATQTAQASRSTVSTVTSPYVKQSFEFSVESRERVSEALSRFLAEHGWTVAWELPRDFVVNVGYKVSGQSLQDVVLTVISDYGVSARFFRGNNVVEFYQDKKPS